MLSFFAKKTIYIFLLILSALVLPRFVPLKSCYAPIWSPDGQKIAFTCDSLFWFGRQVHIINLKNKKTTRLTSRLNSNDPSWSPHGNQIAFTCYNESSSTGSICIADKNGKNLRELISGDSSCCPVWSHDGEEIAFSSYREKKRNFYVFNWKNNQVTKLIKKTEQVNWCSWSPDGKKIAFEYIYETTTDSYKSKICIVNNKNRQETTCVTDESIGGGLPVWSPDSQKIAFTTGEGIFIINKNSSNLIQLIKNFKDYNDDFVIHSSPLWWTSEGKYLAFHTKTYNSFTDKVGIFDSKIHLMKIDKSEPPQYLAQGFDSSLSPNGKQVAFSDNGHIKLINLDTHKKKTSHNLSFD